MFNYEVIKDETQEVIKRIDSDGNIDWVPIDPANSDYAAYLTSLEAPTA